MEPLTITAIASAALSGYAGHGFNTLADKGLSAIPRIIKRMRQDGELPPNHDLYKALRLSMLDATHYLVNIANELVEINEINESQSELDSWKLFKKLTDQWIGREKKIIDKYLAPDKDNSSAYSKIEKILVSNKNKAIENLRKDLEKKMKQEWMTEWKMGAAMDIPEIAEKLLVEGWIEEEKSMDWFNITTLLFAECLKEEKHVKAKDAFQNRLLSEIKTETEIIVNSIDDLSEVFKKNILHYDFIKSRMTEQGAVIFEIKETTDQTLQYLKEIYTALKESIPIEKLQNNESIASLLEKIKQLEVEVVEKYNEKEEYKLEMVANPKSKSATKAYNDASREWEETAGQLQKSKVDFETIKAAYVRQKEVFDTINWETANSRLKNARRMFYEGVSVKEVDDILLYRNREKDLDALLKEKERMLKASKNFAEEELMLALNRLRGIEDKNRFEKAREHFETSIAVYEEYNNSFAYAYFLKTQNSHYASIQIFQNTLKLIDVDDLQKRSFLLTNLGGLYLDVRRYEDSEICFSEALSILRKLAEKDLESHESEIALVISNLGKLYFNIQRFREAEISFSESLSILRKLAEKNLDEFEPDLAVTLSYLGNLYIKEQRFEDAKSFFSESLARFVSLAEQKSDTYKTNIASVMNSLGLLYFDIQRNRDAERSYLQSLSISKRLAQKNPDAFEPEMVKVMNNLGTLYIKEKRYGEAKNIISRSLSIYRRLVDKIPDSYESDMAAVLVNQGNLFFYLLSYEDAERSFSEALSINRRLATKNPEAFDPDLARTLTNMGGLFLTVQRFEDSERSFLEALSIRRRLAEKNPDTFEPKIAATLKNLGKLCYISLERHGEAVRRYSEALQLYLKHYLKNPIYYLGEVLEICFAQSEIFIFHDKKEEVKECQTIAMALLYNYRDSPQHQAYFLTADEFLKKVGSSCHEIMIKLAADHL